MASRLQDVIQRGLATDRPSAASVAPGTLYFSTDTQITERSDGLVWESYTDVAGGAPSPHHTTHEAGGTDVLTLAESQITNLTTDLAGKVGITDPRLTDARTPTPHASTHAPGGSDPIASVVVRRQITLVIDGGSSPITTGYKAWISVPVAGTLKKWRILADVSGSIVVDVWKDTYANYPPTVADTITASAKPTLSSTASAENGALVGWTLAFNAGDIFAFNVDSVATVKKISLTLEFE